MGVFRRLGYHQTSIRDIEGATGVLAGSLYKAYGSKLGIFGAALDAYHELVVGRRVREYLQDAPDPRAGIHGFFVSTFGDGSEADPGCLLTTSAIDGHTVPEIAAAVQKGLATIEQGLAMAVARARAVQQVHPDCCPASTAAQLLVLYQGVLVLVRAGTTRTRLAAATTPAIDAILGPPPSVRQRLKEPR